MSIFNIICNNINVKFDNGFTYENFIGQFQKHSSKILCIVNQKILHIYDKNDKYPELLKFEYTKKHNDIDEFYFKNRNNDIYCFFGKEALTFLNINDINSYNKRLQNEQSKVDLIENQRLQNEQSKVDLIEIERLQNEQYKKDLSQIKQSKTDLIENERLQNDQYKKDLSQIKQSKADLIEIERLQIKQFKNNNQLRNNSDIKSINIDNIKNLNVVDRIAPNIITIIDKGEKLLFNNYDYEIHITEFE